jgi:hypothetical protein
VPFERPESASEVAVMPDWLTTVVANVDTVETCSV